jgi:hypothetical protein
MIGSKANDVMDAAPGGIKLNGSGGDDVLRGGPGVDKLEGNGGNDVLDSSGDGVRDTDLDCDAEQNLEGAKGTADKAIVDSLDVTPSNCESVEKKGGGTAAAPTTAGSGVFKVPDYEPRKNKKGRYVFENVERLEKYIERSGARLQLVHKKLPFKKVPRALRKDIDDREIVSLKPGPGKQIEISLEGSAPKLTVKYFDEATELKRFRSCPYKGSRSDDFRDALKRAPMAQAVEALEKAKCEWRVARTARDREVTFEQVDSAGVGRNTDGDSRFIWNLTVDRPRDQVDFALSLGARPQAEVNANSGIAAQLAAEPTLDTTGRLPVTKDAQPASVSVIVTNAPTGRAVKKVELEVYDTSGRLVATQETAGGGARTLSAAFPEKGTARIVARLTDKRGRIAEGFASIKVVDLDAGYFTMDGRYLKASGKAFAPAPPPPPPPSVAEVEARVKQIVGGFLKLGGQWAKANEILSSTAGTPADRLRTLDEQVGMSHVKVTVNGLLDGSFNPAPVDRDAPALIADANGKIVAGTNPAIGVPVGAGDVDALALVGSDGGSLVGSDGATLIGSDGATLVGNAGNTLIGNAGGTLSAINASTASLTSLGKATLVGNAGNTLLAPGAAVISTGGNGLLATQGVGILSDAVGGLTPDTAASFQRGMALMPATSVR